MRVGVALNITKRFLYLLCLGVAILTIIALFDSWIISLVVFIIYNLICFSLLIIDYARSNGKSLFEVSRWGNNHLSIYEKEEISFMVYYKGNKKIKIEMKDEIPDFHFEVDEKLMKAILLPNSKTKLSYFVTPTKRGAFMFGKLHLRYEGKWKLCMRELVINLNSEYKVYPNMKNLRKYRMTGLNNRQWKQGQKHLRMLGRGTSFESLREYMPGDEYRKINWKATARGDKPIINQYEPERDQHVYFFIDTGRPMSYSIRGYNKLDIVVNTALILSDIVNQNGDLSGLLLFNTEVNNMIAPGKGIEHRNNILEALYHIEHTNYTSNYEEAFFYFKQRERHRSIIFFFTDFDSLEEAELMLNVLSVITKNNLVIISLMKDEKIEQFGSLSVKNEQDIYNKGVALEIMDERKKIIRLLNQKGVFCLESTPEKLEFDMINKYIQIKNKLIF